MPRKQSKEFVDWIELELYLAARDWADLRLRTLQEVYVKLFDKKPDLKEIESRVET